MNIKNITVRHLIGGLVGGFVGLVALHFAGFWQMGCGCIFGFIFGFWIQEIFQNFGTTCSSIAEQLAGYWTWLMAFAGMIKKRAEAFAHGCQEFTTYLSEVGSRIKKDVMDYAKNTLPGQIKDIIQAAIWLPGEFIRWFRGDPLYRSRAITLSVMAFLAIVYACAAYFMSIHYPVSRYNELKKAVENDNVFYWMIFGGAAVLGFMVNLLSEGEGEEAERLRVIKYSKGPILFAFRQMLKCLYGGFGSLVLFVLSLAFGIVGFLSIWLLIFAATMGKQVLSFMLFLAQLPLRKIHWLGVMVTLVTTMSSALILRNYLTDTNVWIISLGNGVLCGIFSSAAYHLSVYVSSFKSVAELVKEDPFALFELVPNKVWSWVGKPLLYKLFIPLKAL